MRSSHLGIYGSGRGVGKLRTKMIDAEKPQEELCIEGRIKK